MSNKKPQKKVITVFGGSAPAPGTPPYQAAVLLGKRLAENNFTVQTGGYMGTMEAVSQGASAAGGHVIGITCDEIERWRPVGPNPWVIEEIRCTTLRERLFSLIDRCDAAIALPGGIGTLAEIALMWNEIKIQSVSPRPMILMDQSWKTTLECFFASQEKYIQKSDQKSLHFSPDPDHTVQMLVRHFNSHR